ncbi:60S ribosomal protein L11, partial [Clarias magur]
PMQYWIILKPGGGCNSGPSLMPSLGNGHSLLSGSGGQVVKAIRDSLYGPG